MIQNRLYRLTKLYNKFKTMDRKQFIKQMGGLGSKYFFALVLTDWGPWSVCAYSYYHELAWLKWHPLVWLKDFTFDSDEAFNEKRQKFSNWISRKLESLEKYGLKDSPKLAEALLMGLLTRMALPPAFVKVLILAPYLASLRIQFYLPVILSSYFITFYLFHDILSRHIGA